MISTFASFVCKCAISGSTYHLLAKASVLSLLDVNVYKDFIGSIATVASQAPIANSNVDMQLVLEKVKHDVVQREFIMEMSCNVHGIHDV